MDYTIKIGGAAGQGIQTIGESLSKVFSRSGYHLFSHQDYESRVRGGHNFFQIRFSDQRVYCSRAPVDILVALDSETIPRHGEELSEIGNAVYDGASLEKHYDDPRFVNVPFKDIAVEQGGDAIMANTVATGAVLGMLGMDIGVLTDVLKDTLGAKHADLLNGNEKAAKAEHEFASMGCPRCSFSLPVNGEGNMVIEGNQAIGLAAVASGCKFYAAYPMTPSTGILNFMAGHASDHGLVVEQAEDEISAINMALGASFAGVRAMTGTSGGGFALMVEGLSLAGMTETPVVMVLAQRPGPATGLPTRTEQADLLYALFAAHGEFPRVVFAPGNPEQAFRLINKAFDLTEKYQVPAIILTDQLFADSQWSLDGVHLDMFKYTDYRVRGDDFKALSEYRRHSLTGSGVSPLAVPGDAEHLVVTDSDEHDEDGHIIEDAETRGKMVEKRYVKKMPSIRQEIEPPLIYGGEMPEIVLVGWGSNYGVMREAVDSLSSRAKMGMVHFSELYPFPPTDESDFMKVIRDAKLAICVENNVSGRFAWLTRAETGFEFKAQINKYDGRPFLLEELVEEIDGHIRRLQGSAAGVVSGVR
jgi:2-oxoglutarate ferredoxin oxidoreductase subunit alpha